MTKLEAKELSIEVWQYLADNPNIDDKRNLPYRLWNKIENLAGKCPLCQTCGVECNGCPLNIDSHSCNNGSAYAAWELSERKETATRKRAAQKIVDLIKAWEPEDEDDDKTGN